MRGIKPRECFRIILGICIYLWGDYSFSQRLNIAVLQFDAANISKDEALILTDRLRAELIDIGAYNVVERSVMEEVLKEQGFQQSGCVSTECVIEVGKLVGVEQIVAGSIGKIGSIYTISARMIDVATGSVIAQKSLDCSCPIEILLTESMGEVAASLSGRVPAISRPPPLIYGSVYFESEIDSVEIYFDEILRGYTPLNINNLPAGIHEFRAQKPGYRIESGFIDISPGREERVPITLALKQGQISILPVRENQQMNIRLTGPHSFFRQYNQVKGIAPFSVPEGRYSVLIQELGYHDLADTVFVEENKAVIVEADNEMIFVPVSIKITPTPSALFVDRRSIRNEAGGKIKLSYGKHLLRVKSPKYKRLSHTFIIEKEMPLLIDLTLVPKSKNQVKLFSTIMPGSGQFYAGHYMRGLFFSAVTIGTMVSLNASLQNYQHELDLLDETQTLYRSAEAMDNIIQYKKAYQNQADVVNDVKVKIITYGVILGVTWIINVLDAYLLHGIPDV